MRGFLLLTLLLQLLVSAALAAAPSANREPLKIKSDTLRADNDNKSATFEGKVVARQGDLTLYADRLVISYSGEARELSRAEAFGNVRIVQGANQATGGHAVYEPKLARITLDGSPKLSQGGNVITGTLVTYYVNEQRSVVTGGADGRVEAVILPGSKNGSAKP